MSGQRFIRGAQRSVTGMLTAPFWFPDDDVMVWVNVTVPTMTPPLKAPEKSIVSELCVWRKTRLPGLPVTATVWLMPDVSPGLFPTAMQFPVFAITVKVPVVVAVPVDAPPDA